MMVIRMQGCMYAKLNYLVRLYCENMINTGRKIIKYVCWLFSDLVKTILFCHSMNFITFRTGFVMIIPVA